jgi:dipeptidyl aminopeptidase/acylaminoacyl peptidase
MRIVLMFVCLIFTSVELFAADASTHAITVDDYFTLGILNEISLSPNGNTIAYTEGRWLASANNRRTDIWLVTAAGGDSKRLTFDRAGYDTLNWSPDGKYLYFAASRRQAGDTVPPLDGTRQVWRVSAGTTEIIPVTRVDGGINGFEISPDGNWILYSTSSDEDVGTWSKLRTSLSKVKYGNRKHSRTTFYKLDLNTWRTVNAASYQGHVDEFDLSSDGLKLAMVTGEDSAVITMEGQSNLTILDLVSGSSTNLPDTQWRKKPHVQSPYGRVTSPRWSADGRALAFAIGFDAYPGEVFVAQWDQKQTPSITKQPRLNEVSLHGGVDGGITLEWSSNSNDLYYLADDQARVRVYCVKGATGNQSTVEALTPNDVVVNAFALNQHGNHPAAVIGAPNRMHDVSLFDGKEWKQLTTINAHTKDWALPKISIVTWKGAGGKTVEGILELPADYQPGTPLPVVVNLHGGPTSAVPYNMSYGFTGSVLLASQGYAFFSPNYRGSMGYGDQFMTELVGHENEIEVEDILKGIDQLVADKIADKDRIAVAGWSNGGYLTNCLITKADRFKAASSGAGIVDTTLEWGTNDEPAYPLIFNGGPPWTTPELYRRTSPIYGFGKVKTPTLFHVGEKDPRCPKGNSEMAYRALKDYLNVESELVIYPDEGHNLTSYTSRKTKLTWDLAWFDHYLKGKPVP